MASFGYLWERVAKQPQVDDGEDGDDSKALRVVRTGLGLRDPGADKDFWDDFSSICGDAEGLAALLGVSRDEVAQWPSKVQETKKKVDSSDDSQGGESKRRELVPTGGADFGTPSVNTPDTRPMP
jgi:hypothetical protein